MNLLLIVLITIILLIIILLLSLYYCFHNPKEKSKFKGSGPAKITRKKFIYNNNYIMNNIDCKMDGITFYSLFKLGVRSYDIPPGYININKTFVNFLLQDINTKIRKDEFYHGHDENFININSGDPIELNSFYFIMFYLEDNYTTTDINQLKNANIVIKLLNGLFEYWFHKEYYNQYHNTPGYWFVSDDTLGNEVSKNGMGLTDVIIGSCNGRYNFNNCYKITNNHECIVGKNVIFYMDEHIMRTYTDRFLDYIFNEYKKYNIVQANSLKNMSLASFLLQYYVDNIYYSLVKGGELNSNSQYKYSSLMYYIRLAGLTKDNIGCCINLEH